MDTNTKPAAPVAHHDHPGKPEIIGKVAAEAVGIPAAERDGLDSVQPSDSAYHQHPQATFYPDSPAVDIGSPGTPVHGGIARGKLKQVIGVMTGNKELRAEGLEDEALGLNRSGKASHNVEEMRSTRDKLLEKERQAEQLRRSL